MTTSENVILQEKVLPALEGVTLYVATPVIALSDLFSAV